MIEIIVKGKRGEGSTTVAHYVYWALRILGYNVAVENKPEGGVISEDYFDSKRIIEKKIIKLRTESYEEKEGE